MSIQSLRQSLQAEWFGNTLEAWLLAGLIALFTVVLLPLAEKNIARRANARPADSQGAALVHAVLRRTIKLSFVALGVFLAARTLVLDRRIERIVEVAALAVLWFQFGLWASAVAVHVVREQLRKRGAEHLAIASAFSVISFLAQAMVWLVALALALANMGVNIVALIAGLGAIGAALALATRAVLGNLFASASISLDETFHVGDRIVMSDLNGVVERIGNRSTHIRSISGELIVVANEDLLKNRLRNYGRARERREVLQLRLARTNSAAQIKRAVEITSAAIRDEPGARFDRCHFSALGQDAYVIEAVYYGGDGTVASLSAARDSIDSSIRAALRREGIQLERAVQRLQLATP